MGRPRLRVEGTTKLQEGIKQRFVCLIYWYIIKPLYYATSVFVFLFRDISQCLHSTFHPWMRLTPSIAKSLVAISSSKHSVHQFSRVAPLWYRQQSHSIRWWHITSYPQLLNSTTSLIWETCQTSSRYLDGSVLCILSEGMIIVKLMA